MGLPSCKHLRFFGCHLNSMAGKCVALFVIALVFRAAMLPTFSGFGEVAQNSFRVINKGSLSSDSELQMRKNKFLEVPQIVWGLNNQKIAFARACLTARMMKRTLLMPSLSASLFYKEIDLLQPISFDKVFQFERFNSLCNGFVRLGRYSDLSNRTQVFELQKGSGRKWTIERDLDQLREFSKEPYDGYEDYAKVFDCLVLVEEISKEADKVVSKIREMGRKVGSKAVFSQNASNSESPSSLPMPYIAVHMRIEKDWMIHLADSLLEDNSILNGWKEGLLPFEKKKLGVMGIYNKYPYLFQSAIDYEVCLRANVFVGNSFSTFSSLIALERTLKMIKMGITTSCGKDVTWPSYAYNILGELNGPQRWMTDMSDSSLHAISYGRREPENERVKEDLPFTNLSSAPHPETATLFLSFICLNTHFSVQNGLSENDHREPGSRGEEVGLKPSKFRLKESITW
ncbi:O-fucosyltransferase 23 [Vitis vinifera]|uniref:O-fucosyltransferase family protein n=1 Tax=Vitis vinifera TaxID=29760 RepID=A0A438DGT0_VITVI|nr:O-fucosyltransferase 23 [Vitis vinifera]